MMKHRLPVATFTGLYMLIFGGMALARGNDEFVMYSAAMVAIIALLVVLDRRVRLSNAVVWALAVWGLAHMAGGHVRVGDVVLYSYRPQPWLPKYDQAVHFYGFGVATLAAWESLRAVISRDRNAPVQPTTGLVIACVLIGVGLGAINEVIEFIAVKTLPETNVGGYDNTGWDLVANLLGATAAGIAIFIGGRVDRQVEGSSTAD